MKDAIIVGGGLAGLTAAAVVLAHGLTPLVLEAQPTFGGRIKTVTDPESGEALADLGPTWVWPPYQPVVRDWLDRLHLPTFAQFNDGDAVLEGYGPALRRQPLPGQHGMLRIAGGPGAMVAALVAQIGVAHLRSGALVAEVSAAGAEGMAVRLDSGEQLSARQVILALPPRIAAGIRMPWAGPQLRDALRRTPTWMAAQAKAVAFYDTPFWRAEGLSGRVASQTGPLFEIHDHVSANGRAALFGFVGWPHQRRAADRGGLNQAVLRQLDACFGPRGGKPQDLIIEDWAQDRFITTDLDLTEAPEHPEVRPGLLRQSHLDGRLWFAGSEVSVQSPGLIEGALCAGQAAAMAILRNR